MTTLMALVVSLTNVPAGWADQYTRDWAKNPAIVRIEAQPDRLFAIGDPHGDVERLLKLLAVARLVDISKEQPGQVRWTGGTAVLVVMGDLIDKGPHSLAVVRLLSGMQDAARRVGGQVVVTMGNHEAEFLAGRDKPEKSGVTGKGGRGKSEAKAGTQATDNFIDDLTQNGVNVGGVLGCKGDIGEFLCALPFGAKVGDWFFSHAGDTHGQSVDQLEVALERGVNKYGFGTKELSDPDSILEARLGAGNVWFHPPGKGPESTKSEREIVQADALALGVSHTVQGHQPGEVGFADGITRKKGEMFQRWGLLFLTDTGMSRDIDDSEGAVLSITHGTRAVALCADGTETLLWDQITKQDVGRAKVCGH